MTFELCEKHFNLLCCLITKRLFTQKYVQTGWYKLQFANRRRRVLSLVSFLGIERSISSIANFQSNNRYFFFFLNKFTCKLPTWNWTLKNKMIISWRTQPDTDTVREFLKMSNSISNIFDSCLNILRWKNTNTKDKKESESIHSKASKMRKKSSRVYFVHILTLILRQTFFMWNCAKANISGLRKFTKVTGKK